MSQDRKRIIVSDNDGVHILDSNQKVIAEYSDEDNSFSIQNVGKNATLFRSDGSDNVDVIKKRILEDYNKENPFRTVTELYFNDYYNDRFDDTADSAKECYKINLDKDYDDVYPPNI